MSTEQNINKALTYAPGQWGRVVDLTQEVNLIPMDWGLIRELGIFRNEYGSQKTFLIPTYTPNDQGAIVDRSYEGPRNTQLQGERGGISAKVPHFPLDDAIYPADLDGQLAPNVVIEAGSQLESVARLRAVKMEGIMRRHAITKELARGQALVTGNVYAPSGTLKTSYGNTINMYNEWGLTRQTNALNLNPLVDPKVGVDELFADMQSAAYAGDALEGYVVLCSRELFSALTSHPYLRDIYMYASQYNQAEDLLVGRLRSRLGARYRQFYYGGIMFIEYPGVVGGQPIIPAGQGVALSIGDAVGFLQHAPAQRFSSINQTAQDAYYFEKLGVNDDKIEIMTEVNFAAVLAKPYLVRTVTFSIT